MEIWHVATLTPREREEVPLALHATRPHTVGYIGVSDQEEGEISYSGTAASVGGLGRSRLAESPTCKISLRLKLPRVPWRGMQAANLHSECGSE